MEVGVANYPFFCVLVRSKMAWVWTVGCVTLHQYMQVTT